MRPAVESSVVSTADVAIVGGGIGGLAAAARLAGSGLAVRLFERHDWLGGKAREVRAGGLSVPAGPTVLTLKPVFEQLFDAAGGRLDEAVRLTPLDRLARHWWPDGSSMDLHADPAATREAVGAFAGRRAQAEHDAFRREAARIWGVLDRQFIARPLTGPLGLTARLLDRPADLVGLKPYASLWSALSRRFSDPRLVQLYARYATYCGTSPFRAPATLMLVAHVESLGVWRVDGGIAALARAIAALARARGAVLETGAAVASVIVDGGRASGLVLEDGRRVRARAVIVNADPQAIADGTLGEAARGAVRAMPERARSLSALVWAMEGRLEGAGATAAAHHNIVFSADYRAEFDAIARGRLPEDPSVYVCAADGPGDDGDGRALFAIVNAPPTGDRGRPTSEEEHRCETAMLTSLRRGGLSLRWKDGASVRLGPRAQHRLWPSTGGALYGRASHGPLGSFLRPGSATRLPGLFCAGGGTHPGPGVPMAAISGQLAADAVLMDLGCDRRSRPTGWVPALTRRWGPAAMPGGMSTP